MSISKKNILFIVKSKVETDTYLPIISFLVKNKNNKVSTLILDIHIDSISSPFNDTILSKTNIFTIYNLVKSTIFIDLLYYLYCFLLNIKKIFNTSTKVNSLMLSLKRKITSLIRIQDNASISFDSHSIISSPAIYRSILFSNYQAYSSIKNSIYNDTNFKICMHETFNQFNEYELYSGNDEEVNRVCDLFISHGESSQGLGVSSLIPKEKIINIGSPRFSKFWCKKIDDFYINEQFIDNDGYINILYLPMKTSLGRPESSVEDLKVHNNIVINLLERYDDIKVFIKTHPKADVSNYRNFFQKTNIDNNNRIYFLPNKFDSSSFVNSIDMMLTPGTALVPHFLWSDKPSVLLGECYAKQGYTFIYKDLCFSEIDINRVIVMIRSQNTLKDKKIFNKLNKIYYLITMKFW